VIADRRPAPHNETADECGMRRRVLAEADPGDRPLNIEPVSLKHLIQEIFGAAGSHHHEAERIAHYLVEANLVGHESHGAIRVPRYVEWVKAGTLIPNQTLEIVSENEVLAVLDGNFGFGQVMGESAMRLALDKSAKFGAARASHDGKLLDIPITLIGSDNVRVRALYHMALENNVFRVAGVEGGGGIPAPPQPKDNTPGLVT